MATGATGHHGHLALLPVDLELSHAFVSATLLLPKWEEKSVRAKADRLRNVRSHHAQVSMLNKQFYLVVFSNLTGK